MKKIHTQTKMKNIQKLEHVLFYNFYINIHAVFFFREITKVFM